MEFFEVIRKRRSVRRFTVDRVSEADLREMLEAARIAPSSHNAQPWHFIVIQDQDLLARLKLIVNATVEGHIHSTTGEATQRETFYATNIFDAPVVIAALNRAAPNPISNPQRPLHSGLQGVSAAITQLYLSAVALGYGGCWATLPLAWAREEIEAILEVHHPWSIACLLSIGVPASLPKETVRKPIEEIVTFK